MIFSLAIISALRKLNAIDFNPINGDFQNYNAVRRFTSGQAPFADFTVYLGFGHMFILSSSMNETHIPITIVNGQGEAVISAAPENNVILEIPIVEIWHDDNYFRVTLDNDATDFTFPNVFEILH